MIRLCTIFLGISTLCLRSALSLSSVKVPAVSPATGLPNQFYAWKENQSIRFQEAGPKNGEPLLLVHGLFVNSDHWRKSLIELSEKQGYHVFALDLYGCGYSSKPSRDSDVAQLVNGENGRFSLNSPGVLSNVRLGTASGDGERIRDVDLRHPLGSPYNFFTWSQLLADFSRDVILASKNKNNNPQQVTLVCNSIGTISSFQAVLDHSDLFTGVFVINPNFRELHSAEVAFSPLAMPVIRQVQSALRTFGQGAFDALANPDTVKQILMEPYAVASAVDDTLVKVLLDPLLTPGASDVVFDTLSYSAGPLPEQQLQSFPADKPVWVAYGLDDPWTSGPRVEGLKQFSTVVEKVVGLEGVGHCPHDEAPEKVHPLLSEFIERLQEARTAPNPAQAQA